MKIISINYTIQERFKNKLEKLGYRVEYNGCHLLVQYDNIHSINLKFKFKTLFGNEIPDLFIEGAQKPSSDFLYDLKCIKAEEISYFEKHLNNLLCQKKPNK